MIRFRTAVTTRIVLARPGSTSFDVEGRMKGCLDMPLCDVGLAQAQALAGELAGLRLDAVFSAPCQSAVETSERLVVGRNMSVKIVDAFRNVDHGLWHGKLIDEVRRNQPRVYREGVDYPDTVKPPGGESVAEARLRVDKALRRLLKKLRGQAVALVIPDPLASIVACTLKNETLAAFWASETDSGRWQLIEA